MTGKKKDQAAKKPYRKPEVAQQKIELGVYGDYHGGGGDQGGGGRNDYDPERRDW